MNKYFQAINKILGEYEKNLDVDNALETPYTLIISSYKLTENIISFHLVFNGQHVGGQLKKRLRNEHIPKKLYGITSEMINFKNEVVHKTLSLSLLFSFLNNFNEFLDWFNKSYPQLFKIKKIMVKINLIINQITSKAFKENNLIKLITYEENLEKLKNDGKFKFSKENEDSQINAINNLLQIFDNQLLILKNHENFYDIFILGQKISESMVELYLDTQNYQGAGYFRNVLRDCQSKGILPNECVRFLIIMHKYRNRGVYGLKPSAELINSYMNALKYYLIWFNTFYEGKFSLEEPFNIKKSVILINLINEIGTRSIDEIKDKQVICPQCESNDLSFDNERAEIICNKCGFVVNVNFSEISELNNLFNEYLSSDFNIKKEIAEKESHKELDFVKKNFLDVAYSDIRTTNVSLENLENNSNHIKVGDNLISSKENLNSFKVENIVIAKEENMAFVIEETNKKIEQLIKENQFLINTLIQLSNQVNIFQSQMDALQQTGDRIEDKVDIILNEIKKINQTIGAIQEFTTEQIENSNSDIEIETIREIFSKQYINQLQSYSEEISKKEYYDIEKIKLEDSMGENAWNKLSEKSKTFLITAKVLYNDLLRIKYITDYSGICILVTKALEEEMFKRFFVDFMDYLDKKYHKNYSQYHTALLYKGKTKLFEHSFTMGSIAYVLNFKESKYDSQDQIKNNEEKLMEYCKVHIFSNKGEEEIKKLLNEYACYVEKIRKDYRNPSAHRNAIKKINAKECFELVLDVEKLLKRMLESFDS